MYRQCVVIAVGVFSLLLTSSCTQPNQGESPFIVPRGFYEAATQKQISEPFAKRGTAFHGEEYQVGKSVIKEFRLK
jgi:hypothetical protein